MATFARVATFARTWRLKATNPIRKFFSVDVLFPFGFPWPTAAYLTLYVATLTLHMLLMHYVLAGSAWVAWDSIAWAFKSKYATPSATTILLQDWLPFALGGAITAGVAPLLFVQILYQREFYTANLLLFHRWMSILPILIVAFYLLYLQKSHWLNQRLPALKPWLWMMIVLCFLFVGYSWTENHLLSLQRQEVWTKFFADREIFFARMEIPLRLMVWISGAFSTMCLILTWQYDVQSSGESSEDPVVANNLKASEPRHLARVALISILMTVVFSVGYYITLAEDTRAVLVGGLALPYLILTCVGWGLQWWGWWSVSRRTAISRSLLVTLAIAVVTTTVSMNVLRESIRLAQVDIAALIPRHAAAASVGGFGVFVFFLVFNALVIIWLLRTVASQSAEKHS